MVFADISILICRDACEKAFIYKRQTKPKPMPYLLSADNQPQLI
jgi:hypothetical protein